MFAQEGIEAGPNIARLHHMLAKSILGLSDSLNTADRQRAHSSQYMKDNLEHAWQSLLKAKELQPSNMAIVHDLAYVSSFYQVPQ